jgi:hypothetical protein
VSVFWMIGLSALGCLVVLFLFGIRNERAIQREWGLVLGRQNERAMRRHDKVYLALIRYLDLGKVLKAAEAVTRALDAELLHWRRGYTGWAWGVGAISRPPGGWLRWIAAICPRNTRKRLEETVLSDFYIEYCEALDHHGVWRARWFYALYTLLFFRSLGVDSLIKWVWGLGGGKKREVVLKKADGERTE